MSDAQVRSVIRDILYSKIVEGGMLYLGAAATDWIAERYVEKHLKQHSKLAVGLGLGIASNFVQVYSKLVATPLDRAGEYGIYHEARLYINKIPYMVFTDANTIEIFNMGTISKVLKNGTELTSGQDYTVSDNVINLSTALQDGDKITVIDADGVSVFKKYKA